MSLKSFLSKAAFKATMNLPDNILVRLSGGAPSTIGGDTLDARLQFIAHQAKSRPSVADVPIEKARASFESGLAMLDIPAASGVECKDLRVQAKAGHDIPVRIYTPSQIVSERPLLVWAHMGGGVLGSIKTSHSFLSHMSKTVGMPIVSVEYRLAPEHPFPAGFEDVYEVYEWALGQAEAYGAPKGRAAIGGGSIGGTFAATLAQETLRMGIPKPEYQLLVYPALDFSAKTQSRAVHADSYPLSHKIVDWFEGLYAPNVDATDKRLAPALETSLAELPPAFIYTAGFDMLRDEAIEYANRLQAQGVSCVLRNYGDLCHGFTPMAGISPSVARANVEIYSDLSAFSANLM